MVLMPQRGLAVIIFLLLIGLSCVGIVSGSLIIKKNYPQLIEKFSKKTDEQVRNENSTQTKSLDTSSEQDNKINPFLAFNNSDKVGQESERRFKLFNLNTRKFIDLDPNFVNRAGKLYDVLGSWTPDGKYLALHSSFRVNEILEGAIYFYDVFANKAIEVKKLVGEEAYSMSGFDYASEWFDDKTLIYRSKSLDVNGNTSKQFLVNVNGELSEKTTENKIILKNNIVTLEETIKDGKVVSYSGVLNNGVSVKDLKGLPVGTTKNYVITLDIVRADPLIDLTNPDKFTNPDLQKEIDSVLKNVDKEKITEIFEKYSKPKKPSKLNLYSVKDGGLVKSIEVSNDTWTSIEAKIRPKHNSVIVHEQDKAYSGPYISRYVEINLDNDNRKTLYAGPGVISELVLTGFSGFEISPDGNWLIFYQPSLINDEKSFGENKVIILLNLNTNEKVEMCHEDCRNMRIYIPNSLTRK